MATKKTKKKVAKKKATGVVKKAVKVSAAKSVKKSPKKRVKKTTKVAAKARVGTAPKKSALINKTATLVKAAAPKLATKKAPAKKFVERRIRGKADETEVAEFELRGMGARSGGQSGDTQGISGSPETDSESVEELLEEGQAFEAEVISGVESVPDADQGEVRTHEVPEDDVPGEYRGIDNQK